MANLSLYSLKSQSTLDKTDLVTMVNGKLGVNDTAINAEKVNGLTVQTAVPLNAKFTDTVYTHPAMHAATMITEDVTHRFTTDVEKTTWNNKLNLAGGTLTGTLTTKNIAMQTGCTLTHNGATVIDANGYVWRALYNDLAEWFERGTIESLEPGDVLVWNGKGVEKAKNIADKAVVGVFSDTYGMCLGGQELPNMTDNLIKHVPVGISGRVKVKVQGSIRIGDLLTSSDVAGIAIANKDYSPGTIIGKALENNEGTDPNRIWMLIMNM